jgi:flagellar biosynthesis/type III secretory pathway M-ring protein FliF/YscJ
MQSSVEKSRSLAIVVLAGCGIFLAGFTFVAYQVFVAFQDKGIPVWSGNKVVATLNPLATVLVALALATLVAFIVVRRTLQLMRSDRTARSEL